MLHVSDPNLRLAAAEALSKASRGPQPVSAERAILAIVLRDWNMAVRQGEVAVEPLAAALGGPDRHASMQALARIQHRQALEIALRCLHSNDADLRFAAAKALEASGGNWSLSRSEGAISVEPLLSAIGSRDLNRSSKSS